MTQHTLSPTEEITIARKAHVTLKLSCDLRPDAVRRELATFSQEVIRMVNTKRLKHARLVLVETEGDR